MSAGTPGRLGSDMALHNPLGRKPTLAVAPPSGAHSGETDAGRLELRV